MLVRLSDAGRTVVLITHEEDIAAFAKRVVRLRDGKIVSDSAGRSAPVVAEADSPTEQFEAVTGQFAGPNETTSEIAAVEASSETTGGSGSDSESDSESGSGSEGLGSR
jgi:energy-coupling factor transporter ATP-binding protein EcfA2